MKPLRVIELVKSAAGMPLMQVLILSLRRSTRSLFQALGFKAFRAGSLSLGVNSHSGRALSVGGSAAQAAG